jgi:DnaJ domain
MSSSSSSSSSLPGGESKQGSTGRRPPPSDALMQLWSPDGYYTYLGVPKQTTTSSSSTTTTEEGIAMEYKDLIKKNYRKLSLKHHPDRNGGDAETFRMLNRAQKVLTNPKLKQQYDILGIDLDDDDNDDDHHPHSHSTTTGDSETDKEGEGASRKHSESSSSTASQGIVNDMAQMALTAVMQMGVRTGKYEP